jgi:L-arabinose isomerase
MGDRGKMTGEWLAIARVAWPPNSQRFQPGRNPVQLNLRYLHEEYVWKETEEFLSAVKVVKTMQNNRVGVLGHYYNGMLDVYSDLTQQATVFGNHFELLEFGTLKKIRENVSEDEIQQKMEEFRQVFDVSPDCEKDEMVRAACTSVALDKLAENISWVRWPIIMRRRRSGLEDIVTSLIPGFTLLTGKNIPVAGECE